MKVGRLSMAAILLLVILYGALSMRRLQPNEGFLVVDAPLTDAAPRVVAPGWRFVPFGLGRVSSYPASPVKLRVALSGSEAARTREGSRVELETDMTVSLPAGRVIDLHQAHGPGWLAGWLEPLVKRETASRVASVSFDLVRNRDPELAAGLRAGIQEQLNDSGLRVEALRLAQTAAVGDSAEAVLRVPVTPVDRDLVIIGVDSFDWRLVDPLMQQGRMPAMKRLVARGARANLRTIRPILSPVIWTSIATGVKPSRHGIADFVVTARDTGALVPVTSAMRQAPALWTLMSRQGIEVSVVAWWATWPAETVRGSIITDRVAFQLFETSVKDDWKSPDPAKKKGKTYPAGLFDELSGLIKAPGDVTDSEVGWFLPGGSYPATPTAQQRDQLDALRTVIAAGQTYHRIALRQFASPSTHLKMVYYQGPDEASHLFMRYRPPLLAGVDRADMALFGGIVEKYYELQDRYLGEVLDLVGPEATVILVSDHGFKSDNNRPPHSDPRIGKADAAEWHTPVGVLVMAGPGVRAGADIGAASILDITPTSLALFGLPPSRDMDGQPLTDALDPDFLKEHPISWIDSYGGFRGPPAEATTAGAVGSPDDAEMIEKLRSLGYIGEERMTARNNRGVMALDEGDVDGAIDDFEKALAAGGDAGPMIRTNLARAWLVKGELDKARAHGEAALKDDPRNKQAGLILAGVDIKRGNLTAAERRLRDVIAIDPTFTQARTKLGEILARRGDDEAALAEFRKVVEIAPLSPIEWNDIGNIQRGRGSIDEAMKAYREALRADPRYVGAYNNLGLCLQERGDLAEARRLYDKALAIRPESSLLRNSLGTLLSLQGDRMGAIAQVERAVASDPNWPVGVGNLATLYFESGRFDDAVPVFARWSELEPSSVEARLGLALTLLMTRRQDEAVARFNEVLRLDPDNVRAHVALGETLARSGQLDGARGHLEAAARIGPRIPRVYNTLGEVYVKLGLQPEAAAAFRKSLALQPGQAEVRQRLSAVSP